MSTTAPPNTAPIRLDNNTEVDQVVKGNVNIKKLSKHKYRITFSKIDDFLVYQTWDKDNRVKTGGNLNNSSRSVTYVSAKHWVEIFDYKNNYLKEINKPLFTPTTIIKIKNQNQNYPIVIHKAYMNTSGHVVFTASTKEIKLENNTSSSKKLIKIKIPCGKFNNVRFDIDADNNGNGIVYHHSNCGRGNARFYGSGGAWPGSACGAWIVPMDVVWTQYPPFEDLEGTSLPVDYNWRYDQIELRAPFGE